MVGLRPRRFTTELALAPRHRRPDQQKRPHRRTGEEHDRYERCNRRAHDPGVEQHQRRGSTMTSTVPNDDEFAHIVRLAPLVSIDLIIRDDEQNVLVALRTNEPAKGVYFVPGGCIRKTKQSRMPLRGFSKKKPTVAQASRLRDFSAYFSTFIRLTATD
jgi:hypothetical protein